NATSAVVTPASPAFRAVAGPRLCGSRIVAPATGGSDPSSTTTAPAGTWAGGPSVGTITVTSAVVYGLDRLTIDGWIAPASSSASVRRDGGTSSPAAIRSTTV